MSVLLRGRNPDDLDATYDQMRFYRSTTETGTYELIQTLDLDLSTASDGSPGYTQYLDPVGTENSFFKISFYNSDLSAESEKSDPFPGGGSYLDTQLRSRLRDTQTTKFFTNEEIANFRNIAVKALWPHTWIEEGYDVVITEDNNQLITLPSTIARFDQVVHLDSDGQILSKNYNDFYKAGSKVYANYEFPIGDTLRFMVNRKYSDVSECPETFDDYLLDRGQLEALKTMEMDRNMYWAYTTTVRPEGGNMPSLSRIIERLVKSTQLRLNEIKRVRKPSRLSMD